MGKSRLFSLVVAIGYVVFFGIFHFSELLAWDAAVTTPFGVLIIWLLISLGVIWFAEQFTPFLESSRWILEPNWTVFVHFVGWVLLLLPAGVMVVKKFM